MDLIKLETEIIIKPILTELKSLSNRLNKETREKIHKIQKNILFSVIDAEYRIEGLKKEQDLIKKFLKGPKSLHNKIKKRFPFEFFYEKLYSIEGEIKELKDRINILKSFMDSIVWKFCDNVTIKSLSANVKESPIIGKIGLFYELSALEHLYNSNKKEVIFILNDLTNCIKISDISVIGIGGIKALIECKMKPRKNKRFVRQMSRAEKLKKFLQNREIELSKEDYYTKSVDLIYKAAGKKLKADIKPKKKIMGFGKFKHEFKTMEKVIKEAKLKGKAGIKVNECMSFIAFDLTKKEATNGRIFTLKERRKLDKLSRQRMTPELLKKLR